MAFKGLYVDNLATDSYILFSSGLIRFLSLKHLK
jgi:hypothetical protein